jgi:hypothetical protein
MKNKKNRKLRVLYVLANYPQLSQTYIKNEIEALLEEYEVDIVALSGPNPSSQDQQPYTAYKNHQPYSIENKVSHIVEKVKGFHPDILHTHWLNMAPLMQILARKTGVPYTIRAHSFDSLGHNDATNYLIYLYNWLRSWPQFRGFKPQHAATQLNSEYCLGVLAFPFARPLLENAGISPKKIVECFPVVAYKKFLDKSPNGSRVMNVGACIPKKRMEDFIDLASNEPGREFDLYSIGYQTQRIVDYNHLKNNPVNIVKVLEPEEMPAEYKKHQWLVYTADRAFDTVGWPMAVAEAQAAGVGVCLPNIRPDLQNYLGGAGYLYDSLDQVAKIIRSDVPDEMRELGFEQSKKSDIELHIHLLTDLWTDHFSD